MTKAGAKVLTDLTKPYALRRQKLFEKLPNDSIMLLPAAIKVKRNGDAEYPFRQDSDFYYLCGFTEDNALLAFIKTEKSHRFIIFCQENNTLEARWQGARLGVQGAKKALGADEAYPYSQIQSQLKALVKEASFVYYPFRHESKIEGCLEGIPISQQLEAGLILSEMRLIKDASEIALMRRAAEISAQAHVRAMKFCKPGLFEYELEAEYLHEFTKQGARSPAYTSIVGTGANACILHYIDNQTQLKEGELVLVDAGAEYGHYAADITRVFPVGEQFSKAQKIIYELVLKSQLAAIELARPGIAWDTMQAVIVDILAEGLIALGIISDPSEYNKYYMHNSGHWLGLDVHDAGSYRVDGISRLLEPGMVLTVEPGLYFPQDALEIDSKWRGIGIRIEDDILVTENEPEVLSKGVPKTIQAIEQLRRST